MQNEEQTSSSGELKIILASASPRRQELVARLGLPFEVMPSRYEEPAAPDTPLSLPRFVTELAANKAAEVALRMMDSFAGETVVLGADTLVTTTDDDTGVPLGKPVDGEDACRMLRQLAGRTHRVYTGIALVVRTHGRSRKDDSANASLAFALPPSCSLFTSAVCTRVRFRELSDAMIAQYVATGEPLDKAGAYGAQGYAAPFIESFDGDFFNVVGLPLCEVGRVLETIYPDWWLHRTDMPALSEA